MIRYIIYRMGPLLDSELSSLLKWHHPVAGDGKIRWSTGELFFLRKKHDKTSRSGQLSIAMSNNQRLKIVYPLAN